MKQWKVLQVIKGKQKAGKIIKVLLKNRNLVLKKQIDEFLHPLRPSVLTAAALGISKRELNKAIKRIKKAVDVKEQIIIYGDYDADGICGTAILWEAIDKMGGKSLPYIPKRLEEGYGVSVEGIKKIQKQTSDVKLIITVDNGITANKAIDYAQKKGIEVIITDHHLLPEKLPKALAIVHTTKLSGSGVAWFLARILGGEWGSALELAAIGTIADVMSLTGVNKSLVKYGLKRLSKTNRIGFLALFREAGLNRGQIEAWQVSFIITPWLNAAGRLADAMDSLRLLCTRDQVRAKSLAQKLSEENKKRQRLNGAAFIDAKACFSSPYQKLLFVSSSSYHEGIIGLVAGNLTREFYRPAVVISIGKEFSKGSARSIKGFNIVKAIRRCEKFLVDCGGHPMAAGFTVKTANLEKLKKCLIKIAEKELDEKKLTPVLTIDCELNLSHLTWKLYEGIERFAPFGMANPKPVFCSRGLRIVNMRVVGNNGKHLKIKLDDPQTKKVEKVPAFEEISIFDGIGFGMADFANQIKRGDLVDVAYALEKNVWNNEERLELKIKDIRSAG